MDEPHDLIPLHVEVPRVGYSVDPDHMRRGYVFVSELYNQIRYSYFNRANAQA